MWYGFVKLVSNPAEVLCLHKDNGEEDKNYNSSQSKSSVVNNQGIQAGLYEEKIGGNKSLCISPL